MDTRGKIAATRPFKFAMKAAQTGFRVPNVRSQIVLEDQRENAQKAMLASPKHPHCVFATPTPWLTYQILLMILAGVLIRTWTIFIKEFLSCQYANDMHNCSDP